MRHLAGVHLHNSWKRYFAFQPLSEKRLAQSSYIIIYMYHQLSLFSLIVPVVVKRLAPLDIWSSCCLRCNLHLVPSGCKAERLPVISVGPLWDKLVANICNKSDNLKTLFQHYTCQMSHDLDFFPS